MNQLQKLGVFYEVVKVVEEMKKVGVKGASSQLGSLSTGTILGLGTGETVWPGWIVLEGDLRDERPH